MEANELRIGNYVLLDGENIEQIYGIGEGEFITKDGGYVDDCQITPIKLTEKWLIDFGFGLRQSNGCYDYGGIEFYMDDGFLDNGLSIVNVGNPFMFVHQLQNAMCFICNKELKLNPQ